MSAEHHNRFCIPPGQIEDEVFRIAGEEFRHLRVKRLKPGDTIIALDGEGLELRGQITGIYKSEAVCRIMLSERHVKPAQKFILGIGALKPGPMAYACEKATECGADEIIPLLTEFSQRAPGDNEIQRLNRVTIASMKQCGRFFRCEVMKPGALKELLEERRERSGIIYASAGGLRLSAVPPIEKDILLLVGPEGGFSPAEEEMIAAAGAFSLSLSDARLRSETTAVVATALVAGKLRKII